MKKIISLVLITVLCFCSLSAFAMQADLFTNCVETCGSMIGMTVTSSAQGSMIYYTLNDPYPSFVAQTDGNGNITGVTLLVSVPISEFASVGESVGNVMAVITLAGMLAKCNGDTTTFSAHVDEATADLTNVSNNITNILNNISGNVASIETPISCGNTVITITVEEKLTFDFTYTPNF